MIPTLTKHLTEHAWSIIRFECRCGELVDIDDHPAHVASTFQAALDAAGATTRTEWAMLRGSLRVGGVHDTRSGAEYYADPGDVLVSRTVVTMPWQPAEEVEA